MRTPGTLAFSDAITAGQERPAQAVQASQEHGPRALVFSDEQITRNPAPPARSEPAAINFDSVPRQPASGTAGVHPPNMGRSVSFPPDAPKAPQQAKTQQLEPARAGGPAPLVFPSESAKPKEVAPARPLFSHQEHRLLEPACMHAQEMAPEIWARSAERVRWLISTLLPLEKEGIETFGDSMLAQCRDHAIQATHTATRYIGMEVAEQLVAAAKAAQARPMGVLGKLRQTLVGGSLEEHRARLNRLKPELQLVLKAIRENLPEVQEDGNRLTLHLVALKSVLKCVNLQESDPRHFLALNRTSLLTAASTQPQVVVAQLKLHENTASLQMAECDKLVNVTLSAVALAGNGSSR